MNKSADFFKHNRRFPSSHDIQEIQYKNKDSCLDIIRSVKNVDQSSQLDE